MDASLSDLLSTGAGALTGGAASAVVVRLMFQNLERQLTALVSDFRSSTEKAEERHSELVTKSDARHERMIERCTKLEGDVERLRERVQSLESSAKAAHRRLDEIPRSATANASPGGE